MRREREEKGSSRGVEGQRGTQRDKFDEFDCDELGAHATSLSLLSVAPLPQTRTQTKRPLLFRPANSLSGSLPSTPGLAECARLKVFHLWGNQISGPLPDKLLTDTALTHFWAFGNPFSSVGGERQTSQRARAREKELWSGEYRVGREW